MLMGCFDNVLSRISVRPRLHFTSVSWSFWSNFARFIVSARFIVIDWRGIYRVDIYRHKYNFLYCAHEYRRNSFHRTEGWLDDSSLVTSVVCMYRIIIRAFGVFRSDLIQLIHFDQFAIFQCGSSIKLLRISLYWNCSSDLCFFVIRLHLVTSRHVVPCPVRHASHLWVDVVLSVFFYASVMRGLSLLSTSHTTYTCKVTAAGNMEYRLIFFSRPFSVRRCVAQLLLTDLFV